MQEGQSKKIELKEQSPHLASRMLQHLYTFDYPGHKMSIGDDEESSHVSELHTHAQMYAIGDEYDIHDLKEEALWKFEKAMEANKGLSDELTYVIKVIPTVYETTPDSDRGLRDLVVAFGVSNLERMQGLPEFKSTAILVPIYMTEVLPGFFNELEEKKNKRCHRWICPECLGLQWDFSSVACRSCAFEMRLMEDEKMPAS